MDFKQFYKTINFDIDNEIRTAFQATQGDTKSRGLLVDLIVGGVLTPVTTEEMTFYALKPDGTRVMTAGVKDGTGFRIDFTNQTFAVPGDLLCTLVLSGTNGEKIADKKFKLTVDSSLEDGAIISEDERGILDRAFDLASDIVPRLEGLDVPLLENLEQEVILARGTEPTLGARLDGTDAQLVEIENKFEKVMVGYENTDISSLFTEIGNISSVSGDLLTTSTDFRATDFIDVSDSDFVFRYVLDGSGSGVYTGYNYALYDEEQNFISGWNPKTDYTVEEYDGKFGMKYPTENAKYARFSLPLNNLIGGSGNVYNYIMIEPIYKQRLKYDYNTIENSMIVDETLTTEKISEDFMTRLPYLDDTTDLNDHIKIGNYVVIGNAINSPPETTDFSGPFILNVERFKSLSSSLGGWYKQVLTHITSGITYQRIIQRRSTDNTIVNVYDWVRLTNLPYNDGLSDNVLTDKVIVNFGDSIYRMQSDGTSISDFIKSSGATVHCAGFGGCRMASHEYDHWTAFSMWKLSDAIVSGDWTDQDNALNESIIPSYFAGTLANLKTIDFNAVDYITIGYGTNDYTGDVLIENEIDDEDVLTFKGALRYSLRTLMSAYPHLKVLLVTPHYRVTLDGENNNAYIEDSDTKSYAGGTLDVFVEAEKVISKEFKTPYLDQYFEFGINKHNYTQYFDGSDGTHHNQIGRRKIAEKIISSLTSNF